MTNQKTKNQIEEELVAGLVANFKGFSKKTLEKYAQDMFTRLQDSDLNLTGGLEVINAPPSQTKTVKPKLETCVKDLANATFGTDEEPEIQSFTDPELHMKKVEDEYTVIGNEFNVFDSHYEEGKPILLEGPKGCGKSLAAAKWSSLRKLPTITFDCSEGVKEGHLIGTLIVRERNGIRTTPFHFGILPTIIEVANRYGGAVLILEEINALTVQMQKILNGILDWRHSVYVEKIGKHVKLNKGCKLLVVGTMNPSSYSGVNEINDDLLSRFTPRQWDYPTMGQERKILNKLAKKVPSEVVKNLLKLAQETRAAEKRGDITHSISTRELADMMRIYPAYGKWCKNPLTEIVNEDIRGMYHNDDEAWKLVKSRIESIFGREVFNEALKKMDDDEIEMEASQ